MNEIEFKAKAQEIAAALGGTITGLENYCPTISVPGKAPFHISARGYGADAGRLSISLSYPRSASGRVFTGRDIFPAKPAAGDITVNGARPAADIAKDIQRRFFPIAGVCYLACVERAKQEDNYKATVAAGCELLANVTPNATVTPARGQDATAQVSCAYGHTVESIKVRRDSAEVTLTGSHEHMHNCLATLRAAGLLTPIR